MSTRLEARRRGYNPAELAALAYDPDPYTRLMVADNPCCPPAAFEVLSRDPWLDVRVRVAARMAPPKVMETLARDPDPVVRAAMAGNDACPAPCRVALARDPDPAVRLAWAKRYVYIPLSEEARAGAMSRIPAQVLAAMTEPARDPDLRVRVAMAQRHDLPDEAMELLFRDQDRKVRYWMTRNPWCPPALLAERATDPDAGMRLVVAWHHATPASAQEELERDAAEHVRQAAAGLRDQAVFYNTAACYTL